MKRLFVICLHAICVNTAFALDATSSNLHISGYVDTSYNHLSRSNQFTGGNYNRVYDLQQNGFTLHQAAMNLAWTPPEGFGAVTGLLVGRDAYTIAPYGWNPYFGSQTLGLIPTNAYVQYTMNKWTLMGGLYESVMGAETYIPTENTNFSRSISNGYAEPGFMLGIRATYHAFDAWKLMGGVNSGWSTIRFATHYPSLEYGVYYDVNSRTRAMLQGLSGQQRLVNQIATGPLSRRDMWELVGSYALTEAMTLQGSYDIGIQRKALLPNSEMSRAVWQGLAGYLNYEWNDRWHGSIRAEVYNDTDGYTTSVRQNWRELTVTLAYQPIKQLIFRGEARHDLSNVSSFVNSNGIGTSSNQQSFALEGLYKF